MPVSFRDFLAAIKLKEIDMPVSCDLEAARAAFAAGQTALRFNNPVGSAFPLVLNSFYDKETLCASIPHAPDYLLDDALPEEFAPEITDTPPYLYKEFNNLTLIPAVRTWEHDGGYALTLPCVVTDYGGLNIGMYRVQALDERRAIVHVYPTGGAAEHMKRAKADGLTEIEAAIILGAPPAVMLAAVMPLKADELTAAGALTGKPVQAARHGSLLIPAESEIVLIGKISLTETAIEGPFGNYTGGYGTAAPFPVFELEKAYARENAVCPNTAAGTPHAENCNLMNVALRLLLNSVRKRLPQVKDFNFPDYGIFGGIIFISVTDEIGEQELLSVPLFKRYKKICLLPAEADLNDIENCMRLFAYSGKPEEAGESLIFNCTPENLPLLKMNTENKNG